MQQQLLDQPNLVKAHTVSQSRQALPGILAESGEQKSLIPG
jgi:hypothetical protein